MLSVKARSVNALGVRQGGHGRVVRRIRFGRTRCVASTRIVTGRGDSHGRDRGDKSGSIRCMAPGRSRAGGIRTLMDKIQRILSPQRLPFRHRPNIAMLSQLWPGVKEGPTLGPIGV